ncbi:hypothetical protein BASA50_001459 [Batrachochytrium salamandrivorans]|uniref:Uncharacterized protein n=1 Tax=Batrachochytrium salamandrivorans TaxID=1357716 RepID=A0ABQ8FP00_9FUNG|nr:hypothetical protein BASA50_001459 [Batrachochytrium salamandrivorans]KAH9269636.1 hypothetical protein BASA83_008295 [Batrachochytrium salamandrivorans]
MGKRQTSFQEQHAVESGISPVKKSLSGSVEIVQCLFCVHIDRERREDKVKFFDRNERSGIHLHMNCDKDSLEFVISRPAIVDRVVMNLFFHPEEDKESEDTEPITKANAMKLFQLQEDGSYVVVIKNSLRFDLVIQHVSVGLSFRQTATVMTQYRNACKIPKLAGINDHMVGQFVRILLAVSLQVMSNVINHPFAWAFSLAADCSTHMGVPFLDQRIRVCVHGVLYNLHLVLVPFFGRHTAQNYVKLIKVLLDSLSPIWRDKLDIVVKNATHGVLDESFYKTAHAFSVHLRAQQTLMTEMGSKCPKDTTRWIAFGSILKWLLQHRRQLMAHVTNKQPVQAPSNQWWVIVAALAPVFEKLQITFARLQSPDLIISQQRKFLSNLMVELAGSFNMHSISDIQLDDLNHTTIIVRGNWLIKKESVIMHIHDQGSWVRDLHSSLSNFDQQSTLEEVATFAFCIVANGLQIQAERDSNNNARELEVPPVMPADLVKLHPALFIKDILNPYRNHVSKHWSQDMIDLIEIQHRELIVVYGREPDVKAALDTHDERTYFNDA